MITLDDAIQRARLMAGEDGILNQQSYNLLVNDLNQKDRYPFTMALVEYGITTRTGSIPKDSGLSFENKLQKWSQAEENIQLEEDEDILGGEISEPIEEDEEIQQFREVLENAGIVITKDGMVNFYQSSIPGIYKDKLPQAMPLQTAVKFWEQRSNIADKEKAKVDDLQDILAKLRSQVQERSTTGRSPNLNEIDSSMIELDGHRFITTSKSPTTQAIGEGIDEVYDGVMSRNWNKAERTIKELQGLLEEYGDEQLQKFDDTYMVYHVIDKLIEYQSSDPERYQAIIGFLGGIAAKKLAQMRKIKELESKPMSLDGGFVIEIGSDLLSDWIVHNNNIVVDSDINELVGELAVDEGGNLPIEYFDNTVKLMRENLYSSDINEYFDFDGEEVIKIVEGNNFNPYIAVYYKEPVDPEVGIWETSFDLDDLRPIDNKREVEETFKNELNTLVDAVLED